MERRPIQNLHSNNPHKNLWLILVGLVCFSTFQMCDNQNKEIPLPPLSAAEISPIKGLTTNTFTLDASTSEAQTSGEKLFYRWDWEGDSIWDAVFSSTPLILHRYLVPGMYHPTLEVLTSSGLTSSIAIEVEVEQGYSPPTAMFTTFPESGNFKTQFTFDASCTKDDEDSLGQLLFRWDWEGDSHWDTDFKHQVVVTHSYTGIGEFSPILEVKDPKGLKSDFSSQVMVDNINQNIDVKFQWDPIHPIEKDTVFFDASATVDVLQPGVPLVYYWKIVRGSAGDSFDGDLADAWLGPFQDPYFTIVLHQEGEYHIGLRILDKEKLQKQSIKSIEVFHKNRPPVPTIVTSSNFGNLTTQFLLDAWQTMDLEDLISSVQVRWDFNGDSRWDTEFSHDKIVYHQFPISGSYKVILEAMDPEGLSDTTSILLRVSNGRNETGFVLDQRWGAKEYYSTVKIGDQWWMSENMNFAPYRYTDKVDTLASTCYNDDNENCNMQGGLYTAYSATQLNNTEKAQGICPDNWHIPSREEWEALVRTIGGESNFEELLIGGSSDFNADYPGYSYKRYIGQDNHGNPIYKWTFTGKGSIGYYWTSTVGKGDAVNWNHWTVTFSKTSPRFSAGYYGNSNFLSVRCVKN